MNGQPRMYIAIFAVESTLKNECSLITYHDIGFTPQCFSLIHYEKADQLDWSKLVFHETQNVHCTFCSGNNTEKWIISYHSL